MEGKKESVFVRSQLFFFFSLSRHFSRFSSFFSHTIGRIWAIHLFRAKDLGFPGTKVLDKLLAVRLEDQVSVREPAHTEEAIPKKMRKKKGLRPIHIYILERKSLGYSLRNAYPVLPASETEADQFEQRRYQWNLVDILYKDSGNSIDDSEMYCKGQKHSF